MRYIDNIHHGRDGQGDFFGGTGVRLRWYGGQAKVVRGRGRGGRDAAKRVERDGLTVEEGLKKLKKMCF